MTNPLYEELLKSIVLVKRFPFLKIKKQFYIKSISPQLKEYLFFKKLGLFPGDRVALKLKKSQFFYQFTEHVFIGSYIFAIK